MGGTGRQEVEGFGLRKRRGAVKGKSPGRPRVTGWMWTLVIHPSIIHHPPPTTHPSILLFSEVATKQRLGVEHYPAVEEGRSVGDGGWGVPGLGGTELGFCGFGVHSEFWGEDPGPALEWCLGSVGCWLDGQPPTQLPRCHSILGGTPRPPGLKHCFPPCPRPGRWAQRGHVTRSPHRRCGQI